jgi:hypothetical protein
MQHCVARNDSGGSGTRRRGWKRRNRGRLRKKIGSRKEKERLEGRYRADGRAVERWAALELVARRSQLDPICSTPQYNQHHNYKQTIGICQAWES